MTGLKKAANEIRKRNDAAVEAAQQKIPAQNLQNQVLSKNIPPATGSSRGGVLLSDDDPQPVGTVDPGSDSAASRADHVHGGGGTVPTGAPGDMLYFDATGTLALLEMSGVGEFSGIYAETVLGTLLPVWATRNGLSGDLGGTTDAALVTGLQGFPISSADPTTGMMLIYDGSAYTPRTLLAADIPDLSVTYQPLDADLTALAGLSSTGLAARTAANTWAQRSIAGTANRVSVTNGNGVSGDPTLDISASYAGQVSITTLGTITSGTWSGSNLSESQITGLVSDLSTLASGIANSQPLDGDLTAIAALSSTGLAARTAANTWAQRTITGTSNRITVTNGDGASGNPTLDISTSYAGQNTITTLGTIGTGVWQGTKIGLAYGGTNADLSATGGANQIVRQNSSGGAFTVSALVAADLPATAVTPASYGSATQSPTYTVDAAGRITAAANVTIAPVYTSVTYSGLTTGQIFQATGATAAGFGALNLATATSITGILSSANGGTGINNAGKLTLATDAAITGGGTLALGGFTLTAPATGTAALRGVANTFSDENTFLKTLHVPASTSTNATYGIRFGDSGTDYGNFQALDLGGVSYNFFCTNRQFNGNTGLFELQNTRVGADLQISGDALAFFTFASSSVTPTNRWSVDNAGNMNAQTSIRVGGTQVMTSRQTGWNAPTTGGGALLRGTLDTGATLVTLARTVGAMIADLRTHGLLGT